MRTPTSIYMPNTFPLAYRFNPIFLLLCFPGTYVYIYSNAIMQVPKKNGKGKTECSSSTTMRYLEWDGSVRKTVLWSGHGQTQKGSSGRPGTTLIFWKKILVLILSCSLEEIIDLIN
jgi:hypothetical protein